MMKKSFFTLVLYSSLLTASEIAYRFVFGIETLPTAKIAETFALTFVIAALYLFARYKATRLLIAVFFAFSIIANNVHYAVYQSWMTGINYWLMLKEVTEVGSAGASMLDKLWLPALWGVLEVVLFCSLAKFRRKTHFAADILFIAAMLLIFGRHSVRRRNTVFRPNRHTAVSKPIISASAILSGACCRISCLI